MTNTSLPLSSASALPGSPRPAGNRLVSLDVLRGLTVACMILVNNAGDGSASYAQLRHSRWNGCTFTDLVFPMFLFIMGVSMALSFEARLRKGAARGDIAWQVLRRSLLIAAIGLLLNALPFFHLHTLRYCGVLQRIGACYLVAGLAMLFLRTRGAAVMSVVALIGYWWMMTKLPVPGYGHPGVDIGVLDPMGNLASFCDRRMIPLAHRYRQTFYDPEGLLSTLPAVGTVLIGALTAAWLRARKLTAHGRLGILGLSALISIVAGLAWSESFPLNKRLWTSSYVLLAAGISMGALALLSWGVDAKQRQWRGWEPALAFGTNALSAYVLSEVLAIVVDSIPLHGYGTVQHFLFLLIPAWAGTASFRSLLYSIGFVAVCFVPVWWLFRRRIFLKL